MSESILKKRHSVRVFEDRPVDESIIKEIIEDAHRAPSWCQSQPWKAYVATGKLAKEICKQHYENNLNGKSWAEVMPPQEENWNKDSSDNVQRYLNSLTLLGEEKFNGFLEQNKLAFNSPAIVYITVPKNSSAYEYYDAGAFGYGICLAAYERGVGSIPAYEFVRYPGEIHAHFDIPEDEEILIGIGLGYAKEDKINEVRTLNDTVPLSSLLTIK